MGLQHRLCILFLLLSLYAHAQETVFITQSDPGDKPHPEYLFAQLSLGTPLRGNPYKNEIREEYDGQEHEPTVLDFVVPNGLNVHGGLGVHLKTWVAVSANAGTDWIATEKIVSAPVYASLTFNPQIWEEVNVYLQAGAGRSFALGRGDLSGGYQKYRVGVIWDNHASVFLETSINDFPLHEFEKIGSISFGVAFFSF